MWLPSGVRVGPEGQFGDFIEGLGPSQLVGRQVLGSPCLGEIQLGLFDRKGHLEVEVIRARGLMAKMGSKLLPGEFLYFYLLFISLTHGDGLLVAGLFFRLPPPPSCPGEDPGLCDPLGEPGWLSW